MIGVEAYYKYKLNGKFSNMSLNGASILEIIKFSYERNFPFLFAVNYIDVVI